MRTKMSPYSVQGQKNNYYNQFMSIVFFVVALIGIASIANATYTLPADRAITWQGNVGVSGGIPSRTTIYSTLSPSGADDTLAIQTAINNCPAGQVVKLNAGTFNITSLSMKSNMTLRGSGLGTTILRGTSTTSSSLINFQGTGYSWDLSANPAVNLSGGYTKGSTSITTSTAHGWKAGDIIVIDQLNNALDDPPVTNIGSNGACTWCGRASGGRALGQVAKITGVPASNTATLEIPLYWNYDSTLAPQAVKVNAMIVSAGVESLTVDNGASGNANQKNYGTISMTAASNCWLDQVEGIGSYVSMVKMQQTYRNTIRGCKFHEGVPAIPINGIQYGSGRGYGIWMSPWASANLLENNQLYHLSAGVIMNGVASGNVISYNYIHDIYYIDNNWGREAISSHGAHPIMNLIEGNYSSETITSDFYWGSSSHNVYFRNKQAMTAGKTCGTWTVALYQNNRYYSMVGNVFGTAAYENAYEQSSAAFSVCPGPRSIYMLGYSNPNGSVTGLDALVSTTLLRHANWDSVSNGIVWNGSNDRALPPSFYLSSKPTWWGSLQWPCIGPDVTPMFPAIPADGSTPWSGKSQVLLPIPTMKPAL